MADKRDVLRQSERGKHGRQEGCVETKGEGGSMADKRDVSRERDRGMHGRQEGCAETQGEAKRKGMHEE